MEPTAFIKTQRGDLSNAQAAAHNLEFNFNGQHYLMSRKPDYFVHLFNVSEQTFEVTRPPIVIKLVIPGRKPGERYAKVASLPQPLLTPLANIDSNELSVVPQDTRRFCMDIVNPDNLGLDQAAVITGSLSSGTNDLGKRGVFWSLNEVPTDQELEWAEKRMIAHYKAITERANTVQVSDPKNLPDTLTPEHFVAAAYMEHNFGMVYAWHTKLNRLAECALCGERVKEGVAFHRMEDGGFCVSDWDRAIRAGIRTKAQAFEATEDPKYAPKVASAPAAPSVKIPTEK